MGCWFCAEWSRKTPLVRGLIREQKEVRKYAMEVTKRGVFQAGGTARPKVQSGFEEKQSDQGG